MIQTVAIVGWMALVAGICFAPSAAHADSSAAAACKALESSDFSTIQDAPTQVMEARVAAAAGEVPAHCLVQGYIWPQIGFELRLPTSTWNGNFLEVGIGGYGGSLSFEALWCDDAVRRGYACILFDTGHKGTVTDALWAYNNLQAEVDYAIRSPHVTAVAGKAMTQHYYGKAPKYSYFMGCSGGGRQALLLAQRFPWDFDGIIALDPNVNLCNTTDLTRTWNALATHDKNGKPLFTDTDLALLHNAVLAQCDDMDDNIKDGVIGDPRNCKFDPAELLCNKGRKSGCLSQEKVDAAKKVYGGPVTSNGERLFSGAMPGAEKEDGLFKTGINYTLHRIRYMTLVPDPGPNMNIDKDFFDTYYKRNGVMAAIYGADNPNLRQFNAAGGKLIIAGHWSGGSPLALNIIDYYEMVEKIMGGRKATQEFARLFMMPGHAHCQGGAGANSFDYVDYLAAWVEQGRAPDVMIGGHVEYDREKGHREARLNAVRLPKDSGRIKFTRPVYPYPLIARYKGAGDPNDYRSFEPAQPGMGQQ